ncbi:hypothetical protein INR49_015605 [Caranx melampygus]|nr:hypothetical protein INR49_015605 [Caranx melampygus]
MAQVTQQLGSTKPGLQDTYTHGCDDVNRVLILTAELYHFDSRTPEVRECLQTEGKRSGDRQYA